MINYFFNITVPEFDNTDLHNDVLTIVRKNYHLSRLPQKDRFSQNSEAHCVYYDYSIEKDRVLKWQVADNNYILSDSKSIDKDKYCVNYYTDNALSKRLIFSKLHTLLKVEYYDLTKAPEPYCTVEPRKATSGLCLLVNRADSFQPSILYSMPDVHDDYVLNKVNAEFTDYTALASTNEGVTMFMTKAQLENFELFVDRCMAIKLTDNTPERFIDDTDALLAKKLNPKDFNIKRNLSNAVDISMSDEFTASAVSENAEQFAFRPHTAENADDASVSDNANDTDTSSDNIDIDATLAAFLQEAEQITEYDNDTDIVTPIESTPDTDDTSLSTVEAEVKAASYLVPQQSSVADVTESVATQDDTTVSVDDAKTTSDYYDDDYLTATQKSPDMEISSANNKYLYYGELTDGKRCGYGRTATEDGRTAYEGYYHDNKRNGVGTYFYRDGTLCYFGEWKDNNRDGMGIGISSVDKSIHIGKFSHNKPDGDGVRLDSDGNVVFVRRSLSDNTTILIKFNGDNLILSKYNEQGDKISDTITDLTNFSD